MAAPGHDRAAMLGGQPRQFRHHFFELRLDHRDAGARLKHNAGIHDVLCRRAPMDVAPGVATGSGELSHEADDGIADVFGVPLQRRLIQLHPWRRLADDLCSLARDDPGPALRDRECDFRRDIGLDLRAIGEDRAHRWRAEDIAIKRVIEERRSGEQGPFLSLNVRLFEMYGHLCQEASSGAGGSC